MRISFGNHCIELKEWSSKQQMSNALRLCSDGMILLQDSDGIAVEFYSAVVHLGEQKDKMFGIGICFHGHGLVPYLLPLPNDSLLIFGFDTQVIGISILTERIAFEIKLDSLFFAFLTGNTSDIFLVRCETGILSLDTSGQVIWRFEKDIITEVVNAKGHLLLKFLDEQPVKLDILTGEVIDAAPGI